ncbi:MAG: hypothetical protein M0Z76_07070 [Gammaproteobacteria bacterium]|nr:hypothetical protein [Gammaproteobacteria bacterium]
MSGKKTVTTTHGRRHAPAAVVRLALWGCLLCPPLAGAANWQDDAQQLYRHLGHLHWIAAGRGPKVLYTFVDPNSAVAHTLISRLAPQIAPDGLTVRALLVGYLTPSSAGKAAAILQSSDPLATLDHGEARFVPARGSAIAPAPMTPATRQILKANFRALTALEGNPWMRMAPLLVYRDRQGHVHVFQGRLDGARLDAIIRATSR